MKLVDKARSNQESWIDGWMDRWTTGTWYTCEILLGLCGVQTKKKIVLLVFFASADEIQFAN